MLSPLNFEDKKLSFRRTKIVATQGPATSTPEVLDAMIAAGVDVFRLNFSHGSHAVSYTHLTLPTILLV